MTLRNHRYHNKGMEVQKEPYKYLLSESEQQYARNLPFRFAFNGSMAGLAAMYYLSRQNELARVRAFKISFDMVFGMAWRSLIAVVVADQVGRRMFVNYDKLKFDEIANNEVRKVMRTMPNAKPHYMPHEKANSYIWT